MVALLALKSPQPIHGAELGPQLRGAFAHLHQKPPTWELRRARKPQRVSQALSVPEELVPVVVVRGRGRRRRRAELELRR